MEYLYKTSGLQLGTFFSFYAKQIFQITKVWDDDDKMKSENH
jgi:hypothetical protein